MTLREFLWGRYWPAFKDTLSPRWQERTEQFLRLIDEGLGHFDLSGENVCRPEYAEAWINRLRARYSKPAVPNKILSRVKHVYRTAVRWEYCTKSPFADIKRKKEAEVKFLFLTDEQFQALLDASPDALKAYQWFARYTGQRVSSLWRLEERDIDLKNEVIIFRRTKNGEDLVQPMHSALKGYIESQNLLKGEPRRRVLQGYSSPENVSVVFWRVKRRVGVPFRFHDYRHNVGAALGSKFQNTRVIMEFLGHKDPRMSARYTHIKPEALKAAVEDALPKAG